ncbi:MAG: sugar transporter [Chlorobi bacterium]|nr:sugar transporter [Chlorobiota bacterium]
MKKITILILFFLAYTPLLTFGQVQQPVKWTFEVKEINKYEVKVIAHATIDDGWKMYGIKVPENGPFPTNIVFEKSENYRPLKKPAEVTPSTLKHDEVFNMDVPFFKKKAIISQNVRIIKRPAVIKGYVEFMTCNNESCLPPDEVEFNLEVK